MEPRTAISRGPSGVGINTSRKRLSEGLAAYVPFGRLRNAEAPHRLTVRGLIPVSRAAWVSESFSVRIFATVEITRSQVSLNFSGLAEYWASVRGGFGFAFALTVATTARLLVFAMVELETRRVVIVDGFCLIAAATGFATAVGFWWVRFIRGILRACRRTHKTRPVSALFRSNWSGVVSAKLCITVLETGLRMEPEAQQRLRVLVDRIFAHVCAANGLDSYEELVAAVQDETQDKNTSPAPWLHKTARTLARDGAKDLQEMYGEDSVDPGQFYEILGLINTKEKLLAPLADFPDASVQSLERVLTFVLKRVLPAARVASKLRVKHLPQFRRGGAPSKRPGAEECRQICDEIGALHRKGVLLIPAQRQTALKWNKSPRMIQMIWADRGK